MNPTVLFPGTTEDEKKKKIGRIRGLVLKVWSWTNSIHITRELVRTINDRAPSFKLNDQKPVLTARPSHLDLCASVRPSALELWFPWPPQTPPPGCLLSSPGKLVTRMP